MGELRLSLDNVVYIICDYTRMVLGLFQTVSMTELYYRITHFGELSKLPVYDPHRVAQLEDLLRQKIQTLYKGASAFALFALAIFASLMTK